MRTATLFMPLFAVLADLSDHTKRYRYDKPLGEIMKRRGRNSRRKARDRRSPTKHQSSPSPPGASVSAIPENETAASPAREAAAPNQPSTEREQPGRQTPRKVALRERSLNGYSVAAGHSTFIEERPPNVRTHSADAAAA
jgi:hypothetical protein